MKTCLQFVFVGFVAWLTTFTSMFATSYVVAQNVGVELPDGFEIKKVAGDELATNIFCMTVNSQGQPVVSGPGYIRTLIDKDTDGVFDSAITFANGPATGAQGMFFEDSNLYCTGDGGLLKFTDANEDGVADGKPETLIQLKTGGEHFSHAVRRGPDGWMYVLCGNMVPRLPEYFNGANSPVKNPEAGFLMRISPDWKTCEIVAHGFRNAYDFDFNRQGEIFVYDSDGERDITLPWYRPTRVYQVRPGDHAGWVSAGWKRPSHFFDMPKEISALGRGSPTGVTAYLHNTFGNEYENAVFVGDWTFGRVVVHKQDEKGDYDRGTEFVRSLGQFGFAVTDIEVDPIGGLLISVGGRGTEGGVYRISRAGAKATMSRRFRQPLSSRTLALWRKLLLLWNVNDLIDKERPLQERLSTIQLMTNVVAPVPKQLLLSVLNQPVEDEITAALVSSFALHDWNEETVKIFTRVLNTRGDKTKVAVLEALVGRDLNATNASVESLQSLGISVANCLQDTQSQTYRLIFNLISANSEFVSYIDRSLLSKTGRNLVDVASLPNSRETDPKTSRRKEILQSCLKNISGDHRSLNIRLAQLAMGGCGPRDGVGRVFDGYTARFPVVFSEDEATQLAHVLPTDLAQTDQKELNRIASMLGKSGAKFFDSSNPGERLATDAVEWLINVACTQSKIDSESLAKTFLDFGPKIEAENLNVDRNWNGRRVEIAKRIFHDRPELIEVVFANPQYGSHADHVFLHQALPGERKPESAAIFQSWLAANPASATMAQLNVATKANDLDLELYRKLVANDSLKAAAIRALALRANAKDRSFYLDGLKSFDLSTLKQSAIALWRLSKGPTKRPVGEELGASLASATRLGWDQQGASVRDQLIMLMRAQTGKNFGYEIKSKKVQNEALISWRSYLVKTFPQFVKQPLLPQEFGTLLERVDWSKGDSTRGRLLYQKRQCALCHDGGTRLGPKLDGVTKRFSRKDLFRAIMMPSEQVPDRYRSLVIETADGVLITGTVIYESVDGITLMEASGSTLRVNKTDIESRWLSEKSLMPEGLLDDLNEGEFADLFAYLSSL